MNINIVPGGLLDALQLPAAKIVADDEAAKKRREAFLEAMKGLQGSLQQLAAQAPPEEFQPLEAQRSKLYEAFQKLSQQSGKMEPKTAEESMSRLLTAVQSISVKASEAFSKVASSQAEWLKRQPDFDDMMDRMDRLEKAGDPKAETLRKLAEAIQGRVNSSAFQESVNAFDKLSPKFEAIVGKAQGITENGTQAAGTQAGKSLEGFGPGDLIDIIPHSKKSRITIKNKSTLPLQLVPGSAKPESKLASIKGTVPTEIPPNGGEGSFEISNSLLGPVPKPVGTGGSVSYLVVGDPDNTRLDMRWENGYLLPSKDTFATIAPKNDAKYRLVGSNRDDDFDFEFAQQGSTPPVPTPGPTPVGPDAASSCMVTVTNGTQRTLTLGNQGHERGDFMTFPDKKILKPGESTSFVSVETPNAKDAADEGCKGFLLWQVGDPNTLWRIEWDNPEGSKNVVSASFNPANAGFNSLNQIGQGEENVPTSFTLTGTGSGGETPVKPPGEKSIELLIRVVEEGSTDTISGAKINIADKSVMSDNSGNAKIQTTVGKQAYEASREGYQTNSGAVDVKQEKNDVLIIELKPEAGDCKRQGLTVLVKDKESGELLEGAAVTVGDQSDTTSGNGLATVELPVGKHDYKATLKDYDDVTGKVEIVEGDNPELVIEMTKGGDCKTASLAVLVVDDQTSSPVPNATVKVGDKTEQTSSMGLVVLTLKSGDHKYEVKAELYDPANGKVTVKEGDDNELTVRLKKQVGEATVTFTVLDEDSGQPLEGADVALGSATQKTDASGTTQFKTKAGKQSYQAGKKDYETESGEVDALADNDTPVEVRLKGWNPPPETPQPTLRKGDEGADGWVEYLQALLIKLVPGCKVTVNGKFDQATYDAVKLFQGSTEPKCQVDGIVGNETWSMLRKQEREPVGVRNTDEHVESGAEARWARENNDFVTYDAKSDTLTLIAFSVGDAPIDKYEVMIRTTHLETGATKIWSLPLGPPTGPAPTGAGQTHAVAIQGVRDEGGGGGRRKVEAYMPKELGGDYWTDGMDMPGEDPPGGGGGGKGSKPSGGGGGGGGTTDPSKTKKGVLRVVVEDDQENPIEGAIVSATPGDIEAKTTNAEGVAEFKDVPVGIYDVAAVSPDGSLHRTDKIEVDAKDNGGAWYMILGEKFAATLDVSVWDNDGEAVAGASVKMLQGSKVVKKGVTDTDGYVIFELVGREMKHEYSITAEKDGTTWTPTAAGPFEPYSSNGASLSEPHTSSAESGSGSGGDKLAPEKREEMKLKMEAMTKRLDEILATHQKATADAIKGIGR